MIILTAGITRDPQSSIRTVASERINYTTCDTAWDRIGALSGLIISL